ncbi:MAG: hypothetical protein IT460_17160 [Planctomycetes bacterium]|nr:hypothetical protein [Planctomycetota bacterium]
MTLRSPVRFTAVVVVAVAAIWVLAFDLGNRPHGAPAPLPSDEALSSPSPLSPPAHARVPSVGTTPSALGKTREAAWREAATARWRGGDRTGAIERWRSAAAGSELPSSERRDAADRLAVGLLSAGPANEAVTAVLELLAAECSCAAARPEANGGRYSIWLQDCGVGEVETLRDRVMVALEDLALWDPAGPGPSGWVLDRLGSLDSKLATDTDSLEELGEIRDFLRIAEVFGPPATESTTERALAKARPMVSAFLRRTAASSSPSILTLRSWVARQFGD